MTLIHHQGIICHSTGRSTGSPFDLTHGPELVEGLMALSKAEGLRSSACGV